MDHKCPTCGAAYKVENAAPDIARGLQGSIGDRGMTDALIEAVARAIYQFQMDGMECSWENEGNTDTWREFARAALSAIEASGHVVVPVHSDANIIAGRSPLDLSEFEPKGEGAIYIDGITLDEAWLIMTTAARPRVGGGA